MAGQGSFGWYELATTDLAAAQAFYGDVVGWTGRDFGGDMAYTVLYVGETGVGGMMAITPEGEAAGVTLGWSGYIGVPDTDAAAASLEKAGGTIRHKPDDIPGVGRFSIVTDPQGALFTLLTPSMQGEPLKAEPDTPGHVGWHELHTSDWEAALAFYSGQFGWTKGEPFDMGPMGTYQLFVDGGRPVGGMMNDANYPKPTWLYYFNVPAIDAAVERVTTGGGKVLHGPHQVPGGSWIVIANDPQGAQFALMAPGR